MNSEPLPSIVRLTRSLIGFQTVHDSPKEIRRSMDFVSAFLERAGGQIRYVEYGQTPSLLALPAAGYAPVLLMSHLDVVAAAPEQFEPFEKEGKLYGRGSLDDKYAVALSLVLFERHLKEKHRLGKGQPDLPFGLLITSDEEIGGFHGAGRVLKEIETDFVILLDGGSPDEIVVKQKGFAKLRLIAGGRTAHGSQPWLGENAVNKLIDDCIKLRALFDGSKAGQWYRTANLSLLHSGRPGEAESFNQVPDHAEAVIDVRYTEHDDLDSLLRRLRQELQSEIVVEARGPVFVGGESPYLDRLLELLPQVRCGATHSASDARFLTEYGIPGIVWGADGDESAHSPDEHVDLQSVLRLYHMLDEFLRII